MQNFFFEKNFLNILFIYMYLILYEMYIFVCYFVNGKNRLRLERFFIKKIIFQKSRKIVKIISYVSG